LGVPEPLPKPSSAAIMMGTIRPLNISVNETDQSVWVDAGECELQTQCWISSCEFHTGVDDQAVRVMILRGSGMYARASVSRCTCTFLCRAPRGLVKRYLMIKACIPIHWICLENWANHLQERHPSAGCVYMCVFVFGRCENNRPADVPEALRDA
jgi:hypothetical protein